MRVSALRVLLVVSLTACLTCLSSGSALGQQPPQRPLFESLLRGVLEQQIEKAKRKDNPAASNRLAPTASTREWASAFQSFERDIDRLAASLARVSRQSNPAAKLHNDAVRLRATASRAVLLANSRNNLAALQTIAATIDRDWRDLEFRLKEAFVANASLQGHIDAINRSEKQVSQIFSIAPQFSQRDAIRELDAFSDTIGHLVEDIEYELRYSPDRPDLTLSAWRIRQTAKYITGLLENNANNEGAIREFATLDKDWRALSIKLRKLQHRHMDRDIHRAEESLNEVRRLLRVPQTLDRAELSLLASNLMNDVDDLFQHVTLNRLIEMRSPQTLLPAASEFYGLCEHFKLTVDDDFRRDNLVNRLHSIDTSWRSLSRRLNETRDRQLLESLESVDHSLGTIRLLLGAPQERDGRGWQEATSSLTVLGRRLEIDVVRRVRVSSQYSTSFRRSIEQEMAQFTADAARLNEATVRGASVSQLSRDVQALGERWGRLQMLLTKLEPRDHPGVNLISSQISEQLLKLGVR